MFRFSRLLVLFSVVLSPLASGSTVLVVGDSISAAYGMEQEQGWVYLLEQRLRKIDPAFTVVNASISGDTTGGGLIRLPDSLGRHRPDLVVIELGGNDGLRGYPISRIRENLDTMIRLTLDSGARIILVGMMLPPNYGARYTRAFHALYTELATAHEIDLMPFLLEGIATDESLMQRDGIHPRPEAQTLLLENIWPLIAEQLSLPADAQQGPAS